MNVFCGILCELQSQKMVNFAEVAVFAYVRYNVGA